MPIVVVLLMALLVAGCGSTPSPTPGDASSFTPDEAALVEGIRADARVGCVPIRTDLPTDASAGVGCRPDTDLVASVGVYLFPDDREATRAYLERLDAYGIEPRSGSCAAGSPGGDRAWTPGDDVGQLTAAEGVMLDGEVYALSREGCFIDENGHANSRATCGRRYIGVLGKTADLEALDRWTRQYPKGASMDTPAPPGICVPG
jgi:hypothetical protein